MRAIRVSRTGGPEVMTFEALATPAPGPGQALVEVRAAGVNFIDCYHRSGLYELPLPFGLGREGAGVVTAVGEGVGDVRPGDRVAWSGVAGSYATHVVADAAVLVPVPAGVDDRVAAAVMLQGMTAHYLTTDVFPLGAGHTCLVHAAAGGVGLLLLQLAKRAGAHVIGTVGNAEKAALARASGADEVVEYTKDSFVDVARRANDGRGVDVVYDSVGKDTLAGSLASLRVRGMMVSFGQSSGKAPPVDPLTLQKGSLFLTRPALHHYTQSREELLLRATSVLGRVAAGTLDVRIHAALPLAQAEEAHRLLEGRATTGKVVLIP